MSRTHPQVVSCPHVCRTHRRWEDNLLLSFGHCGSGFLLQRQKTPNGSFVISLAPTSIHYRLRKSLLEVLCCGFRCPAQLTGTSWCVFRMLTLIICSFTHSTGVYECQPVLSSSLDSGDTVVSKVIDSSTVSFKQGQLVWKPQEAGGGKMSHIRQFRSVSPRR